MVMKDPEADPNAIPTAPWVAAFRKAAQEFTKAAEELGYRIVLCLDELAERVAGFGADTHQPSCLLCDENPELEALFPCPNCGQGTGR